MEIIFLISLVITFCLFEFFRASNFKKTSYFQVTQTTYKKTKRDKGRYGEYQIYKRLQHLETEGAKFLFNVYIPKARRGYSEIDVLMLCPKGGFVFESKNFSGWIFGNDRHTNWTQVLKASRGRSHKIPFYNPVRQNASHIKYLRSVLHNDLTLHSIIVFSDHCTLKNITLSQNVAVIRCHQVKRCVEDIMQKENTTFSNDQINAIYNMLYPYTQLSDQVKIEHITYQ